MRKFLICLVLVTALCLTVSAASGFWLEEDTILYGMGERSWARGYEPTVSYGTWTAYVPLAADTEDEEVTLRLVMKEEAVSPFKPQRMEVTARRNAEGIFPVKLAFKLYSDCQNGDYPAELVISGQEKTIPFVVRIRDGLENTEKPSVTQELVSSELKVGAEGKCVLRITNHSRTLSVQNVVLRISEASGDLLPASSDAVAVGELLPGESRSVSVGIAVSAEAKVKNYALQAELTYDSLQGAGEWKETLTVPVQQELRLEHGALVMGDTVVQGSAGGLSMELMNLGAGEVKNIRMTLNLGDFVKEQTVLVGGLQPGGSVTGKLSFATYDAPLGSAEGELTVRYEDAFGNEAGFTEPVRVTVEEPTPLAPIAETTQAAGGSLTVWLLGGLCALLAVGLLVQGIILRGRLHKLEEDRL